MLHVPADPEREDVARELDVLLHAVGHGGPGAARGGQAAPGHLAGVPRIVPPPGLLAGHRVVVGPGDPMLGQQVEDGPGGRIVEQVAGRVVDQAMRRTRDEETAVGEGGTQARTEPVIGQRERPGEPVIERQVSFGPVAHADGSRLRCGVDVVRRGTGPGLRLHGFRTGHEPVALPLSPLLVARVPALGRNPVTLDREGLRESADGLPRPCCWTRRAGRRPREGSPRPGRTACRDSCRRSGSPSSAPRCA